MMKHIETGNISINKIEYPKRHLQSCPFCKEEHPIIVNGLFSDIFSDQILVTPDQGYSFCNCKSILFTKWENIDQTIYDDFYFTRFQHPQTEVLFTDQAKDIYPRLEKNNPDIKVFVEVGNIEDTLLNRAKEKGWETYGLDINEKTNNEKHKKIIGNIEDPEIVNKLPKADVIWASHILEHIRFPLEALKNLYDCLNDKGQLFVSMPDPFFIDWENPHIWGHWHVKEHYIMWDMDSFIREAKKLGLKNTFSRRNISFKGMTTRDYNLILQK